MKTQRFFSFVAALLITYLLTWGIIACAQVGNRPDLSHVAARTHTAVGARSAIL
jgi:hypothetical protein